MTETIAIIVLLTILFIISNPKQVTPQRINPRGR